MENSTSTPLDAGHFVEKIKAEVEECRRMVSEVKSTQTQTYLRFPRPPTGDEAEEIARILWETEKIRIAWFENMDVEIQFR